MLIQDLSYSSRHDLYIDPSSVEFRSALQNEIVLPYSGEMPRDQKKSPAWIWITPNILGMLTLVFCIKVTKETIFKQQIDATNEEMLAILQTVLSRGNNGLASQINEEWKSRLSMYQQAV